MHFSPHSGVSMCSERSIKQNDIRNIEEMVKWTQKRVRRILRVGIKCKDGRSSIKIKTTQQLLLYPLPLTYENNKRVEKATTLKTKNLDQ